MHLNVLGGVKKDPITLHDYIQTKCFKHCLNSYEVHQSTLEAANLLGVDQHMLLSIMRVESSFKQSARNMSNVGPMQINIRYHKPKFITSDYFNIRDNVRVGAIVYKDCLKRFKQKDRALKCYNGNADPNYTAKVLKAYQELKKLPLLV